MQTPVSNFEVTNIETSLSGVNLIEGSLVSSDVKNSMQTDSLNLADANQAETAPIKTKRELGKLKLESLKIQDNNKNSINKHFPANKNITKPQKMDGLDGTIQQVLEGLLPSQSNDLNPNTERSLKNKSLDCDKCWLAICAILSDKLDNKIFSAWFKSLKLGQITPIAHTEAEGDNSFSLKILTPNKFFSEHIKKNYEDLIKSSASTVLSAKKISLEYDVLSENQNVLSENKETKVFNKATKDSEPNNATTHHSNDSQTNLSLNYNFSNFVVGTCNQFAHAACSKVAESPGIAYNPLLIYGGVGLGKTHLANAIGNAARRRKKKVLLVSSEMFVSELISSLKNNSMERFKSKFRSLDVLIIDDIQFIIGKERTQEEFFHTFNELYGKNKQIIITSDKLPQDLIGLEERLRTRFQSGLSVDLQAPDFETRVAILSNKCEQSDLKIPEDVLKLIAMRIDTNVRELEGALTRLQALCNLLGEKPSLQLAQKVLDTISPLKSRELTTDYIKEVVAKEFNVSVHDLSGKRRTQNIALARQVAMYLCRKHTARSFPEIGALFGGRDHSTVIHAIKSMTDRMPIEESLRSQVEKIVVKLEG